MSPPNAFTPYLLSSSSHALKFSFRRTGDQRPCERCGDKKPCRDGKRKKAKYLEGTQDEDLIPVQEKEQEEQERARNLNHFPGVPFASPGFGLARPGGGIYQLGNPQSTPHGFPMFANNPSHVQHMTSQPYVNQLMSSTIQPQAYHYEQQRAPLDDFTGLQASREMLPEQMTNPFAHSYSEIDVEHMGFDNKAGALEYGVLNRLSDLVDTPPSESLGGFEPTEGINYGMMPTDFNSSPASAQQWRYPQQPGSSQGAIAYSFGGHDPDPFDGLVKQEDRSAGLPPSSLQEQTGYPSPISGSKNGLSPQGMMADFDGNPATTDSYTNINPSHQTQGLPKVPAPAPQRSTISEISASARPTTTPSIIPSTTNSAQKSSYHRSRNPSTVYSTVTEPYSYTKAFHDLMALIRKRFSQKRTAHIAKALASIRPSFISSMTKLEDDDRLFMEKCLQRTLLEYEDSLSITGTPTILCRRTGEVVAASEGFSILTGWRKAVLLGKEPNLNVNKGGDAAGHSGTDISASRGTNTARPPDTFLNEDLRLKPVSVVDLLDDDSVCDFFDDYAHLAFGDSRGSVTTPCKLLRYKIAKLGSSDATLDSEAESRLTQQRDTQPFGKKAGEQDKIDCMFCWSVKRDVFDIPMLFVMNFLPCFDDS